jgi:hypothetical protein
VILLISVSTPALNACSSAISILGWFCMVLMFRVSPAIVVIARSSIIVFLASPLLRFLSCFFIGGVSAMICP